MPKLQQLFARFTVLIVSLLIIQVAGGQENQKSSEFQQALNAIGLDQVGAIFVGAVTENYTILITADQARTDATCLLKALDTASSFLGQPLTFQEVSENFVTKTLLLALKDRMIVSDTFEVRTKIKSHITLIAVSSSKMPGYGIFVYDSDDVSSGSNSVTEEMGIEIKTFKDRHYFFLSNFDDFVVDVGELLEEQEVLKMKVFQLEISTDGDKGVGCLVKMRPDRP